MNPDNPNNKPGSWQASLHSNRLMFLVVLLAAIFGLIIATLRSWLTDDAFISFRYSRNLVEGLGLVFNPGERVEGMTNLLWTLWCSLGLSLGFAAEIWSQIWGVMFYLASIGLLGIHYFRFRNHFPGLRLSLPIAVLAAVAHTDLAIYATGGLETSAFTFLALGGYLLLTGPEAGKPQRPIAAGACLALAALTRPDGVVFAFLGGLYLCWKGRPWFKTAFLYALAFMIIVGPVQLWRIWYYGDFFPNTYYAKSAYLSWWSQGWHYTRLYFTQYWALLLGLAGIFLVLSSRPETLPGQQRLVLRGPVLLAAAFAICYTAYVTRVGGCFMFARLLIPAAPFFLILLDFTVMLSASRKPVLAAGIGIAAVVGIAVTPCPVTHLEHPHGITNEWMYRNSTVKSSHGDLRRDVYHDLRAKTLKRYLHDLPVRVAFLGDEARVMYKARIHTAIESVTGLTDRVIARRKLRKRDWVGHEKRASESYLVAERKTHFAFGTRAAKYLRLGKISMYAPIFLDDVRGLVMHWDPVIMEELRRRGARFPDPGVYIDNYLSGIETRDQAEVAREYAKLKIFYFDQVDDPKRQDVFRRRLGIGKESR